MGEAGRVLSVLREQLAQLDRLNEREAALGETRLLPTLCHLQLAVDLLVELEAGES